MINFCVTQFLQPSAVATVKLFYYNVALTFITNNNNNDTLSQQPNSFVTAVHRCTAGVSCKMRLMMVLFINDA